MKPIEKIIRSDRWDKATQEAFWAHLAKGMPDTARLGYCDRKASFMLRSGKLPTLEQAEALLTTALERFTKANAEARSYARSTRSSIREQLGKFEAAALDSLAAGRENPSLAASSIYAARALLRAHSLKATGDVLRLERRVMRDPNAKLMQEYSVWKWITAAACAKARRDHKLAAARARRVLEELDSVPEFQKWVAARKRYKFAAVDITPSELDIVRKWAAS